MLTKSWLRLLALVFLGAWIGIVVASGVGWNPFSQSWDFSNTGAFGDSFGPLSAFMAALAAFAAFETLSEQRRELARTAERERLEDKRRDDRENLEEKRRIARQNDDRKRAFEATFFSLLEALRSIVSEIDVGKGSAERSSRDAFEKMSSILSSWYFSHSSPEDTWNSVLSQFRNDLGHYFRFLYHIILFVDSQKGIDRYFYVRLIRSSLSEAELTLLAFNCAYGEGAGKFATLIEKYALLHNISDGARDRYKLDKLFAPSAFDRGDARTRSEEEA